MEFDPSIPPIPGVSNKGGWAYRERLPEDADLLIRLNEFTSITDRGRNIWRLPATDPYESSLGSLRTDSMRSVSWRSKPLIVGQLAVQGWPGCIRGAFRCHEEGCPLVPPTYKPRRAGDLPGKRRGMSSGYAEPLPSGDPWLVCST